MCARQRVKCLIILLLMISLVSGCSSKEESAELFGDYYKLPDKIIVYRQGDKEEIDEEDRHYRQEAGFYVRRSNKMEKVKYIIDLIDIRCYN